MGKMSRPTSWLLIFACASPLIALDPHQPIRQLYHTAWTARDGLTGEVHALAQTADGFLWAGTRDGLFRFDGVSFERYRPESGSLPARDVLTLFAVPSGGLWIGYDNGGATFLNAGRATNYAEDSGLPIGTVRSFAIDLDGTVWAAVLTGLARFDGRRWRWIRTDWNFPVLGPSTVAADESGTIWTCGAVEGTYFLSRGQRRFQSARSGRCFGQLPTFAAGPDGRFWSWTLSDSLLTQVGTVTHPKNRSETSAVSSGGTIRFDRNGAAWLVTHGDGIMRIAFPDRFQGGRISGKDPLVEKYSGKDGLSDGAVFCLLEDREGNIWVGTAAGLDRFRNRNLWWMELQSGGFGATLVQADHGDVWAFLEHPPGIRLRDRKPLAGLPDWVVRGKREPDGTIWMWGGMGRLRIAERESLWRWRAGQLVRVPMPYPTPVMAIATDSTGSLWVSIRGYGVFYQEHGKWKLMEIVKGRSNITAYSAIADGKGRVWLAYPELNIVALWDKGRVQSFSAANGLTIGAVGPLSEDGSILWAGGELGLAYFRDGRFQTLESADPAGFGGVSAIIPVRGDGLWLNKPSGIVHIPQRELDLGLQDTNHAINVESFDLISDLPEMPLLGPNASAVRDSGGVLWFATPRGVVRINPARIGRNPLAPPVAIRSVMANGKPYPLSQDAVLPPLTRNLRIGYAALSLSIPERVRARYKLEGSDNDWQDAGNLRDAFYTNLGPRKYTFRVIACNNDGIWNETGASWSFEIEPAFYQTAWFHGLYALAGATMIWLVYRVRLRQMTARVNLLYTERLAERTRIARELHDTLLQSFHGLVFRFQAARNMLPRRLEEAIEALDGALDTADQAIAEGRDAIQDIRSGPAVQNDLTQLLTATGQELGRSQEVDHDAVTFRVTVEGERQDLSPIVQGEVYRIAREVLRNAFRHARARQIEAEIRYDDRSLRLRIRDDGKGMDTGVLEGGERPGHWGLLGIRERAKRIGAQLDFWSEAGAGTEIELTVPASVAYAKSPDGGRFRLFRKRTGTRAR
jgi:signal transduction histidine kinase/ligand-binding sensor domain-containing protein